MSNKKLILQAAHIFKSFGATKALADVKFELYEGEVVGLLGENGSGKTTLTTIIAGIQNCDSGEMFLYGKPYKPKTILEAVSCGVAMITQEQATFENLSVTNNLFIGEENKFTKGIFSNHKQMHQEAKRALAKIGADFIDVTSLAARLEFEDRKLVEIARAMYNDPKILIVDETSTTLGKKGRDILYRVINEMRNAGKGVIFISHDLDEVKEVCDRVEILRDGKYVTELEVDKVTPDDIKQQMVGRVMNGNFYRNDFDGSHGEEVVLRTRNIAFGMLKDISFELHRGEILGIGGLADCGMHDLGRICFGLYTPDYGTVEDEKGNVIKSNTEAIKRDFAYISKNRDQEALFSAMSVKDNIAIASLNKLANKIGLVYPKKETEFAEKWSQELSVKMDNLNQYVMYLSGGNKQKVAVGRWLGFDAEVFILDCPTRGIDVAVKAAIYNLLSELKKQGKSIIMISEELPELIGMSDRILIIKDGVISGEFNRSPEITEGLIINYMV